MLVSKAVVGFPACSVMGLPDEEARTALHHLKVLAWRI